MAYLRLLLAVYVCVLVGLPVMPVVGLPVMLLGYLLATSFEVASVTWRELTEKAEKRLAVATN